MIACNLARSIVGVEDVIKCQHAEAASKPVCTALRSLSCLQINLQYC